MGCRALEQQSSGAVAAKSQKPRDSNCPTALATVANVSVATVPLLWLLLLMFLCFYKIAGQHEATVETTASYKDSNCATVEKERLATLSIESSHTTVVTKASLLPC